MRTHPRLNLIAHFQDLVEPRVALTREHRLIDLLVIAGCTLLCGGEGFNGMEDLAGPRRTGSKPSWNCPAASPATTPSTASSGRSIPGRSSNASNAEPRACAPSSPKRAWARFARAVRGHWSVENQCHWMLDVNLGEDQSQARVGHAAENLDTFRRLGSLPPPQAPRYLDASTLGQNWLREVTLPSMVSSWVWFAG